MVGTTIMAKDTFKEGDQAPNFAFEAENGQIIKPGETGKKWVILYFYPKDDTPGCTAQAKTFTSLLDEFEKANAVVYGINTDNKESHLKFKKKYDLKHTLLTDPDGKAARSFGITVLLGLCSRDSVLINPEGKIEKIYRGVKPDANPKEILKYIQEKNK